MSKTISLYGFPSNELLEPEHIKQFIEQHTGTGTICALEVELPKTKGHRTQAKVQFVDKQSAQLITLAEETLWYITSKSKSYLNARDVQRDLVPKPKLFWHSIHDARLHFGCQISDNRFYPLWRAKHVSVKFGFGLKTFHFFLSHGSEEYMLVLPCEHIWQAELHRPVEAKKFLIFQLYGAPKIYKKDSSGLSYFKEPADDKWIREVDFTPSSCIGQSSALCVEFQRHAQLPSFGNFPYFKENRNPFTVKNGCTSPSDSLLVPIVSSSGQNEIPYEILFKISSLVQHGCLPAPALNNRFFMLVDPSRFDIACIEHALEKLYHLKECCYDPATWLQQQYQKYISSGRRPTSPIVCLDDGLVYIRRVQVTPTKVYFSGPELNLSNRVLRNYPDDINNFLRVSFVDEDLDKIHSTDLSPLSGKQQRSSIHQRILLTLRNGVVIGDKKFEFLGFSQSQLRDNSVWMFASRPGLTASDIRAWMGDFRKIKNVATYAARLGQSFGSSRETFNVGGHEIEIISDIEVKIDRVKYNFSDGIGKISVELANSIAHKLGFSYTPSAFQIRYGGYKGVVAVDPHLSKKLSLRKSMYKFESNNTSLDVLGWSKYQPCFLNRQVITLLSTLGVDDSVFERKQEEVVAQLDSILTNPVKAYEALKLMASGDNSNVLKEMLTCGYEPQSEPFLSMMLKTFRASKLYDLRIKSRVFVRNGRSMMGCLDETGTLEYGQVFVQYSGVENEQIGDDYSYARSGTHHTNVLKGPVAVAKNPCLHPGDMRVLEAVDVPALHHLVDCIVFPQKGDRPHTNECSGSDLDGDVYFVCWDPDLIPPTQYPPMDYTAANSKILDHDVIIEEVQEYFAEYIVNDCLGIICNAHVVSADHKPAKAMSDECLELAELSSIAVDFPKTGVAAEIPLRLRAKEYPDFMEKPDKQVYESQNVIGKLFRAVKNVAPDTSPISSFTKEVAMCCYDYDMEVDGFEEYISDALHYKCEYANRLGNLMDYYGIKTEFEILSGWIIRLAISFDRRRDLDTIMFAVKALRKQARAWFDEKGSKSNDVHAKASAWYHVTYHHSYWGCGKNGMNRDHFISFPWCVHDKLIEIKKSKEFERLALSFPSPDNELDLLLSSYMSIWD